MVAPAAFDPWVAALGSKGSISQGGIDRSAKHAAQQFEALLIRQFLSNARSTTWLSDQQESESGWREIADDSLAGYLVKAGGLGLTKQVESLISQAQATRDVSKAPRDHVRVIPPSGAERLNSLSVPTVTSTSGLKSPLESRNPGSK
jgi:Rod binding domain-containing protein